MSPGVEGDAVPAPGSPDECGDDPTESSPGGTSRRRPTWRELRERLDALGFRPSRRLGQNFLVDDGLCRAVAAAADLVPGEVVVEVGVGLGFLTHHLVRSCARVVGVEIDDRLADLALTWLEPAENLELVRGDVLAGKHALAPAVLERLPRSEPWQLVSNLPYAVASPVVALLAGRPNPPRALTVLVQHEVAERLCAGPGDRAWGVLGARLALGYRGRIVRSVGADGFRPRPKVDSAICRLDRRADAIALDAAERAAYDALTAAVFTQRRKRLRQPLAALVGGPAAADDWLDQAGLARDLRAEAVGPDSLLALLRSPRGAEFRERFAGSGPGAR